MTAAIIPFAEIARRRDARRLAEKAVAENVVALPCVSPAVSLEPGTRVYDTHCRKYATVKAPPAGNRVEVEFDFMIGRLSSFAFVHQLVVMADGPGGAA